MSVVAVICARGGSQGVPGKNIRPLQGKPLILYSIEHAKACPAIDDIYVSTDDEQIAEIAKNAGVKVPFIRPTELATAEAGKIPVIVHMMEFLKKQGIYFDKVIDIDVTCPLREVDDITNCLKLLDDETDVVLTGYVAPKNPYFNMVEYQADGTVKKIKDAGEILSRQTAPCVFNLTGSMTAWHTHTLQKGLWGGKAKLYVMPQARAMDIDTELDFKMADMLMKQTLADSALV